MTNPWMKKNPFLSMWLSGVNRLAGSLRGQASAQARRQAQAVATEVIPPAAPKARSVRKR